MKKNAVSGELTFPWRTMAGCAALILSQAAWTGEPAPEKPKDPPIPALDKPAAAEKPAEVPAADEIQNPLYLLELARVHLNFGSIPRAEPLLQKALTLADKDEVKYQARQLMATLLLRKMDFKGAAQEMEAALKIAPEGDRARLMLTLTDVHEQAKDWPAAEQAALAVLELTKGRKEEPGANWERQEGIRRLVGIWQNQPGRIEKVIEEAEKALAANPKDEFELRKLVAIYSNNLGDPKKAVVAFEQMLALHPDKDLIPRLAGLYARTNEPEKAADLYKKLAAESDESQARQYAYQGATLLLQAGKKEKALELFKIWAAKASTPSEFAQASSFYEQVGAWEEVENTYKAAENAAKTPAEKVELRLKLADVYVTLKQHDKAESIIRALRKEYKDEKPMLAKANAALIRLYESQNRLGDLKFGD